MKLLTQYTKSVNIVSSSKWHPCCVRTLKNVLTYALFTAYVYGQLCCFAVIFSVYPCNQIALQIKFQLAYFLNVFSWPIFVVFKKRNFTAAFPSHIVITKYFTVLSSRGYKIVLLIFTLIYDTATVILCATWHYRVF